MTLPLKVPYAPMEALLVDELPLGLQWQYEPKWDGFRCIAFRDGKHIELQSKSGQPLARYFPEVVASLLALNVRRFVLDGELVVPVGNALSFDQLLQRIHPAESRIRELADAFPATLIVFDLLVDEAGRKLTDRPFKERRRLLEKFADRFLETDGPVRISPSTTQAKVARKWFQTVGGALDGIIAKDRESAYRSGERTGMQKVKHIRTADCVVGGFRYASKSRQVGSLLLGLYDDAGLLHHVGFTANIRAAERPALTKKLEHLIEPPGFTGNAPGGPSRWSTKRSTEWKPLAPKLVIEVEYDHFTGGRFRHGTRFVRWRPDKSPAQCTFQQVESPRRASPLALTARRRAS